MKPDFPQLYEHLGLRPDCSPEEFRSACLRRIAELHPDRTGDSAPAPDAAIPLEDMIALYANAMRFFRSHGRLPGATPAMLLRKAAGASRLKLLDTGQSMPAPRETLLRRDWVVGGLLIALLVIVVWWRASSSSPATALAPDPTRLDRMRADSAPAAARHLELGMDFDTVLSIQGPPLQVRGDTWDYGTSWLRFEKGRLMDWYSSPLHALRTKTASPPPDAKMAR